MATLASAAEQLEATRAELLSLLASLDEAALDQPGMVDGWSIKNVLAHLAAWEEWVVQVLPQRMASGTTPDNFRERAANENRFNALEVAERAELTPGEQLMELERVRAELLSYVRSLPAAEAQRRNPWPEWPGTLPEYLLEALRDHEAEHLGTLRAALAARE